ncbi:hypothetical protein FRC02_007907 [Tulasnella sp. 418]|nr:hypothetical protein FRC02_007907 [Tulasnella sp. 418]
MLLHNSSNAPFIRYENDLTKLLTKLDEIESHGDEHLREMRKWLVDAIEWELEELDRRKMEEWKRIQSAKAPVPSELEHKDILKEPEERVDVTPIGDCAVSDSDEVPDRVDDKTPVPTIVVTSHNPEVMTRSNVGADAATVTEPSPSNPAPTPSAGDKIAVDAAECRDRSEEKH